MIFMSDVTTAAKTVPQNATCSCEVKPILFLNYSIKNNLTFTLIV